MYFTKLAPSILILTLLRQITDITFTVGQYKPAPHDLCTLNYIASILVVVRAYPLPPTFMPKIPIPWIGTAEVRYQNQRPYSLMLAVATSSDISAAMASHELGYAVVITQFPTLC